MCFEPAVFAVPGISRGTEETGTGVFLREINTLGAGTKDFLDGTDKGQPFDREEQIKAYGEIAANNDGTCGEKIHQFTRTKV